MKLTYEQMKEKFGIRYISDSNYYSEYIIEVFGTNNNQASFETVQEVREKLKEDAEKKALTEQNRIDNIKNHFDSRKLSVLYKVLSFLKNSAKKVENVYKEKTLEIFKEKSERLSYIDNMKVQYLDKNKMYEVAYPNIKNGDLIFVAVSKKNHLDIGVHSLALRDVSRYHDRFSAKAMFKEESLKELNKESDFEDEEDDVAENYCLRIEGVEEELSTGYSFHKVFFNKEDAENYLNEELDKQIAILENHKIQKPS